MPRLLRLKRDGSITDKKTYTRLIRTYVRWGCYLLSVHKVVSTTFTDIKYVHQPTLADVAQSSSANCPSTANRSPTVPIALRPPTAGPTVPIVQLDLQKWVTSY